MRSPGFKARIIQSFFYIRNNILAAPPINLKDHCLIGDIGWEKRNSFGISALANDGAKATDWSWVFCQILSLFICYHITYFEQFLDPLV